MRDQFGCEVAFKCENLQHAGAFKTRGAMNAVLQLPDDISKQGVVTHSSGNHAAALARAAKLRGIPAYVVMPENSARVKIEAVESYGVQPVFCEPSAESRDRVASELQQSTGATLVHPYNNIDVIAGQGTVAIEVIEQWPAIDTLLVPVGGGGLLSGVLVAIKTLRPEIKVVAVEPELADDAFRSFRAKTLQMPTRVDTIADGLRSPVGEFAFEIMQSLLDDIILVPEAAIARAMRLLSERVHVVAEPSGAVTLAGIISHSDRFCGQRVGAVISGGNLDFGSCKLGEC
jgi:threonine dehydratase